MFPKCSLFQPRVGAGGAGAVNDLMIQLIMNAGKSGVNLLIEIS
jgi:hypothetical protein